MKDNVALSESFSLVLTRNGEKIDERNSDSSNNLRLLEEICRQILSNIKV